MTLKQRKNRREIKNFIRELKANSKCVRCKENHPACLDFHHLDKNGKDGIISEAAKNDWTMDRLLKELQKCVILCANCHRKEHYKCASS